MRTQFVTLFLLAILFFSMSLALKTHSGIQARLKNKSTRDPYPTYSGVYGFCRGCSSDSGLYDDVSGLAEVNEAIEEEAGLREETTLSAEAQSER